MKQMKLSVGVSDFEKIRSDGYYYIDKSGWIKGLLKSGAEVTLLTRPRRFGKTLGMSMLANFFDITKEEREAIFELIDEGKRLLDEKYSPDSYNVGINCGEYAGQTVMHVHVHLIPRYIGDMKDPRGGVRGVIPDKMKY